ncbi:MAG: class I SAM-dependent methyltransferase [Caulobacteraceae bacterium]
MENVYRPCPICEGTDISNIKRISFNMDGMMPDFYFLAKCNNCGFVYANTSATKEDYDRYYLQNNRYSTLPTQGTSCLKTYETVSSLIKKYIDKYDNILDVGCGGGDMLKLMKIDGYKYLAGLDPAQTSIDKLIEADLLGIKGSIYDEPTSGMQGKFNVIILSGVLEHLYDLKNAIKNLKLYLKHGGKILCFVPNVLEYYLYSSPLPHYINVEHINHFSPNAIVRLFADNGFSLLECVSTAICFGSEPDPIILAVFEYTDVIEVAHAKVCTMLSDKDLEQRKVNSVIDYIVSTGKKVAVFGTGNFARTLMANTNLNNANIICFLDNDSSMYDKSFCGYKVNPPSFLKEFDGEVLILSMHGSAEIEKQIRAIGFENITRA